MGKIEVVGSNQENGAGGILCPLSWQAMAAQVQGLEVQPAVQFMAGQCVRAKCGFWSAPHELCGVAALGELVQGQDTAGDIGNAHVEEVHGLRHELRALRGAVLGVYAAAAGIKEGVLTGSLPTAAQVQGLGSLAADDADGVHGEAGGSAGEPDGAGAGGKARG